MKGFVKWIIAFALLLTACLIDSWLAWVFIDPVVHLGYWRWFGIVFVVLQVLSSSATLQNFGD